MRIQCISPLILCLGTIPAFCQPIIWTGGYDPNRSNSNLKETILNTSNVNPATFGKIFTRAVDGNIYGQPLWLPGSTPGATNVVFTATMHNTVFAFDADIAANSTPVWSKNLGPSVPAIFYNCADLNYSPEVGIMSTPVINVTTFTIYVVANTFEDGKSVYRLHALDIRNGQEKPGSPVVIQASVPGTGSNSVGGAVKFDPAQHFQRPGLVLSNGNVYVSFGSHCDTPPYHGWFMGYNASNVSQQMSVLCITPNGDEGSIWQSGRTPPVDTSGNVYIETANGDYDGVTNWGESVIKVSTTTPTLTVTDWFTPDYWMGLNSGDKDVGSSGGVIIPNTNTLLAGSKLGNLYVMDKTRMGHLVPGNGQILQIFQPVVYGIYNIALWNNSNGLSAYFWGWGDTIKAYKMSGGIFVTTPSSQGNQVISGFPGGILAVSANGSTAGSGVVWATTRGANSSNFGTFHAYDASDVSKELWNSNMVPTRDTLPSLAKFATPTVANGKVFVPTYSNFLEVYGLLGH